MNTPITASQKKNTWQIILSRFLSNVTMSWKMGLMAFMLFLGILGITTAGYVGLQSLRYQLSNIYDFMLIPISSIERAGTSLEEAQRYLVEVESWNITPAQRTSILTQILLDNQNVEKTITRYDTEWVTTSSPQFTQDLKNGGKIELQQQEVEILASYHKAYDAYKVAFEKYQSTIQAGNPDVNLANETISQIQKAQVQLQALVDVNLKFADFSNSMAQNAYRQALTTGGLVLLIAIILGLVMSYLIAASITSRLGELTQGAEAMQKGNLDQTVAISGRDEVGLLGTAFNAMAKQLKDLFGTLEQRVAARTKDLATVAEVGTATANILESNRLLQEVVDLTKERFGLYHSHIYLLNEAGDILVLAAGAGEPGRKMVAEKRSIPLSREQSLVARAARERKGVTVNDVTRAPDFLPNPLLPNTRSELAVPMIAAGNLVGVFDVQSDQVGRFTEADINIQTTLAAQVAISIQNVRQFEQSKTQADLETIVNRIGQKIQRAASVEDTLQIAVREIGLALGASRVKANIGTTRQGNGNGTSSN